MDTCGKVHIGLTPGDGSRLLLGIDEQQVLGPHAEVDIDMSRIREVDITHHIQRFIVIGIESEVLEQQVGAHDTDGVIVEAHPDTVGRTDQIGGIDIYLTIDIRVNQTAMHIERTIAIAFETNKLVGDEPIDDREWGTRHGEGGIELPLTHIAIGATQQAKLLAVTHQTGLYGMGIILHHHIHQFGADITEG